MQAIPADFPSPNIELKYHMPPGMDVRCRHCRAVGKQPNHLHGYVVRSSNGLAILVGGTCGSKHYGDKWGIIKGRWDKSEDRTRTINRLMKFEQSWAGIRTELFQVLHGSMWGIHDTLSKNLQDRLPKLHGYLLKMQIGRGGDLYIMERFRDLAAEMKLPETNRKQVFSWREKSMGSLQGAEFLTGTEHMKSRFGEVFDVLCTQVNELKKLGSDLTTAQLKARFVRISDDLKRLTTSIARVRSLQRFVTPDHLRRLCDCATDWHKHDGKKDQYRFDGRFIVWSDPDQDSPVKCPIGNFDVPSTPKLDLFTGP